MQKYNNAGIAVYMTVKNGEKFIKQSLYSVENQICKPMEMVIVDDGSTDNTLEVLKEIIPTLTFPIKLIETPGVGRAKALNMAWQACSQPWVANIDADDAWHPKKLLYQFKAIEAMPLADLISTKSKVLKGDVSPSPQVVPVFSNQLIVPLSKEDFFIRNQINHSSVLIRKNKLSEVGGYDETRISQIDLDLWYRLLAASSSLYRVNESLTFKRVHPEQSFEAKKRIAYCYRSMLCEYKGLRLLGAKSSWYLWPIQKFFFGLLPVGIRAKVRAIFRR